MVDELTIIQDKYGQFMLYELLERKYIVNKTTDSPRDLIATVFSAVEELHDFANITRTSYNQLQSVNIAYLIVHRTGNFGLEICECNHMPTIKKTWDQFKLFFWTAPQKTPE